MKKHIFWAPPHQWLKQLKQNATLTNLIQLTERNTWSTRMSLGEKAMLMIPASSAYGATGAQWMDDIRRDFDHLPRKVTWN